MKRFVRVAMLLCAGLVTTPLWADQAADEATIRAAIESYVKAYNAGDAKTLASLWSERAVYQNPLTGIEVTGREAIEEEFKAVLEEFKGSQLAVEVQSIDFVSPNVAVEHGVAKVVGTDGEPEISEYAAVHVRQGDQWFMDRVTEKEPVTVPSHYEQLKPLAWLVGTWVDEDDNARVESNCQWTKNQNYLSRTFTIELPDEPNLSGVQIIGWDAARGKIRSWAFDSDGGFTEGLWKQKDGNWIVENAAVLPDGRTSSSINVLKVLDENTLSWQITGRDVDGEILPNLPEVRITRAGSAEQKAESTTSAANQ
jgi:uncharacterized protein (TIGR02246 family)